MPEQHILPLQDVSKTQVHQKSVGPFNIASPAFIDNLTWSCSTKEAEG